MSDRSKELTTVIAFAATSGSIAASQYVSNWFALLQQQNHVPDWFPTIFALVTFAIAKPILKYIFTLFLESVKPLRRWIFFRDQYIEGLWFDIIKKNEKIISIGHTTISYSEGKYQVSGEDFSISMDEIETDNFKFNNDFSTSSSLTKELTLQPLFSSFQVSPENRGHFHFESVTSDWPSLKYIFIYNGGTRGYGEAEFINNNNLQKYNGCFVHLATGERFTYESFRVSDNDIKTLGSINKSTIQKHLEGKELLAPSCSKTID